MDKQERFSPPAIGGSSLLVIFAVLCLTVFALLGLSTVRADQRLADACADTVSAYYQADCQAQTILAQLRAGQLPEGVTVDGGVYTYSCPISDTQALYVEVRLEGTEYTVLRWQEASTAAWQPDDSLLVWDGGDEWGEGDVWDGAWTP
jgi:hypothetical protein